MTLREQLQQQLESLPDDLVQEIADFTHFMMVKRALLPAVSDWGAGEWQTFALSQFFREEDDVVYTLDDAQEVYKP